MKKYVAVVRTKQEWFKEIKIPQRIIKEGQSEINGFVEDHFQETHYENFNDSWKNNLYLHYSCKPIEEVDFKTKDNNKSSLTNACEEGYCGI